MGLRISLLLLCRHILSQSSDTWLLRRDRVCCGVWMPFALELPHPLHPVLYADVQETDR